MQKNYAQLITGIVIGLILGLFIGKQVFVPTQNQNNTASSIQSRSSNDGAKKVSYDTGGDSVIPQKVYTVLKYILANHQPMPGYVGGRVFTNREKIVPTTDSTGKTIDYQEWDVNPKVEGQNRGTERILTGSDGRAWYTNDHYQTFTQIR